MPLENNPKELPPHEGMKNDKDDEKEEWEIQRDEHKTAADEAYKALDVKKAIEEYTNALTFDPEWHILYSNRSAAHLSNGEKSKALADARKCVELKPDFVKGHSRLANAMFCLGRYNEARGVYRRILSKLDENHEPSKKGIKDCGQRIQFMKQQEMEILLRAQEQSKKAEEAEKKLDKEKKIVTQAAVPEQKASHENIQEEDDDDEDDLLNDFFDEVEEVQVKKKIVLEQEKKDPDEEKKENKIHIQLTDLGDTETQINRLLCPNHEWHNLNPFRVLDISHKASTDILSRRYKALSLLLHPDKVRIANSDEDTVVKAEQAFEYIRKAIDSLKDEDKIRHTVNLIEQGVKHGKRDYEKAQRDNTCSGKKLKDFQEIATMKIFAEIERKRRDVERRKRKFEGREREQEDAEVNKSKKERDFDKNWKEDDRVEKRIHNWRDFSKKPRT